jgi:uncharacterized protein DUF6326
MQVIRKNTQPKDRSVMLSTLWIFAMFNYVYADILTLYFGSTLQPAAWKQLQTGQIGSVHVTQMVVLAGSIMLETAIAMVLLSRVLPYQANRWANIVVAIIQTAAVAMSLPGALYSNFFYIFCAAIEIACTLFIIWYAWTLRRPENQAPTVEQPRPASAM